MIKKRYQILAIFSLIFLGFSLHSILFSVNNFQTFDEEKHEIEENIDPKISTTALKYSDIDRNASRIYRLFESVNFTINTTNNFPFANYVLMEIKFPNSTIRKYNMTSMDNGNFTYEYKPNYNTPLGFHNVSFLIYNDTNVRLNNHTTYSNFTIDSNCNAVFKLDNLPNLDFHINETLTAELDVDNFVSDNGKPYDFQWNLTIVDSMDNATQHNLLNLQSNVNYFSLLIDNETFQQLNTIYYLKVNMTDVNSGKKAAAYFPFYVKNTDPVIISEIDLSPQEIFRTEDFTVSVNITDLETASGDLTVAVEVLDSEGEEVISELMGYSGGDLFTSSITIPSNRPVGRYSISVTTSDGDDGRDDKTAYLNVKNNYPEIHSYQINGMSMNESISVFYGRDFLFTFNVSDKEGVSAIKVALLNEKDEWYNITREYIGDETEITIRTQDLISGIWLVYIYVIDTDGAVTSLIDDYNMAPQGIRIVPDVISNYIPWFILFTGISIGMLIGIGIVYKYFKSKFIGQKPIKTDKKTIQSKKSIKQKKVKTKLADEESMEKEVEEKTDEMEEEQEEGVTTRKIKRKL
ncbi:MAG: hypothetical protein ACFFDH_11125 [Promethearchaeota archaeon]